MPELIIDQNFSTPISVHSDTYSTEDLGSEIRVIYKRLDIVQNVYLRIVNNDINIKVVLKHRATDRELDILIEKQLLVHEKFNYSFSFNFEYIPLEFFVENESESKLY